MARPRKWATDAERMAAKRGAQNEQTSVQNEQTDGQNEHVNEQIAVQNEHAEAINEHRAGQNEQNEQTAAVNEHDSGQNEHLPPVAMVRDGYAVVGGVRVPEALFAGAGRGAPRPYKGADYVLISRGWSTDLVPIHAVVTVDDWRLGMAHQCAQGRGWQCREHV